MPIYTVKYEEWLDEWGSNGEVVERSLNQKISDSEGTYYGEWQVINSVKTPNGRGLLECADKLILGHIKNGEWAT